MDWYAWYPELFEADTLHLTTLEVGAYKLLLDRYMRSRMPLQDNDRALATITRLPLEEWKGIAANIRPFFKAKAGRLHNKRCDIELQEQDARHTKRHDIAKAAAKARWEKQHEHGPSIPDAMHEASPGCISNASSMLGDATGQDKTEQRESVSPTEVPSETHHPVGGPSAANGQADPLDPPEFLRRPAKGGPYAFEGRVIRLKQADLDRWATAYHALPDLRAELQALDDYAAATPEWAAKWFFRVSGALRKKHDERLAQAKTETTNRRKFGAPGFA
jgi:uncharacterized protein YdaU (DUF1376 family)